MRYKLAFVSMLCFIVLFSSLHSVFADHAGFTEQLPIATTLSNPRGIFLWDIDNDGYVDVVSSSSTTGDVIWYKNNGDNTFGLPIIISASLGNLTFLHGADLNNDGFIDILSASYNDNNINWFKNNGDGTFTIQTQISITAEGASSVFTADLNNDGFIDVISGSSLDTKVIWYKNNGDETFAEQEPISISAGNVNRVLASDIDNDGFIDIVSSGEFSNIINWYKNNGDDSFTIQAPITTATSGVTDIFLADLDGNGFIDILVSSNIENVVTWFKNNEDGTFIAQTSISNLGLGVNSVIASDLDDDGDLDVISGSYDDNTIRLFLNNGDGTFAVQTDISNTANGPLNLAVADLDNNGSSDLVCISNLDETIRYFSNNHIFNYTLKYVDYEGTVLLATDYDFGIDLSLEIPPLNPTRIGYTFVEWDILLPNTMPSNDITLTATYIIAQYKVEFLDFDGTVLQSETFEFESDISGIVLPIVPYRKGYIFDSWDISLPTIMEANDITITALYNINQYLVEYRDYDGTIIQSQIFDYLSDLTFVTQPTHPIRDGYTFTGWDRALPSLMGISDIILTARYLDSEAPVINGLSNFIFKQSEAESFEVSLGEVTDNLDLDLIASYVIYKANGVTVLSNLAQVIEEIKLCNNIIIKYNVADLAKNNALEVVIYVTTLDDIAPTVEGVVNNQVFERKSEVTITFSDGEAKLNGRDFSSGTTIDTSNKYILVVTDSSGNLTIVNFEIQDVSTTLVFGMTGALFGIMAAGIVIIKIKKIF